MTPAICKEACAGFKYGLAGVENGQKCFCGNNITTARAPSAFCNIKCAGKADEYCGGGFNLDLYNSSGTSAGTAPPGTPSGWKGCYSDTGTVKILTEYSFSSPKMTNNMCRTGCASLNYTLAGNELGNRCFCGNTLKTAQILPPLSCNTPCVGDATQHCGGNYLMTLFDVEDVEVPPTPPGWLGELTVAGLDASIADFVYNFSVLHRRFEWRQRFECLQVRIPINDESDMSGSLQRTRICRVGNVQRRS